MYNSPVIASEQKNSVKSYLCALWPLVPLNSSPSLPTRRPLRCGSNGLTLNNGFSSLVLVVVIAICAVGSPSLLAHLLLLVRTWCAGSKVLYFDMFILLLPAIMSGRLLHCMLMFLLLAVWTGFFQALVFSCVTFIGSVVVVVGTLVTLVASAFEVIDDAAQFGHADRFGHEVVDASEEGAFLRFGIADAGKCYHSAATPFVLLFEITYQLSGCEAIHYWH